ncbi:MAG: DUF4097 family beta strand repeat-containing protein [Candidatus Neomarinimicrobiota bacterium]
MKHLTRITAIAICLVPLMAGQLLAKEETIHKTFKKIKTLDIETVSGDCIIEAGKGDNVVVDLVYDYPDDCFEPAFKQSGDRLQLEEHFRGYGGCSGSSEWTITVPKDMRIDFSSASGNLSVSDCTGKFGLESASGYIEIDQCEGKYEIDNASGRIEISISKGDFEVDNASGRIAISNSEGDFKVDNASGHIRMQDVSGQFELDNASGDIEIDNIVGQLKVDNASGDIDATRAVIEDMSDFDTASGDISVTLAKSPEHDITLDSASGNVVLNYNGNPVSGYFEFSARKDRGKIDAPYKFDKEEEYEYQGRVYVRKSFTREKDTPRIVLSTASGKIELKLE